MFLNIFKREKFDQKLKSPHDLLTLKPSLNMDIFLTQTHRFASEGLYSPPRSRVEHFLWWMDTLLDFKISTL